VAVNQIRIVDNLLVELGVLMKDGPILLQAAFYPEPMHGCVLERLAMPDEDNLLAGVVALLHL
jgi:hypothetical protein